MSDLPEVRHADCGHFIPVDMPPVARQQNGNHEQDVYLCEDCRSRLHRPRVETKVVDPDRTTVTLKYRAESGAEDFRPSAVEPDYTRKTLPQAQGAAAAVDGKTEDDCPYSDKRTRDAKEWLRGFREAKNDG